MRNNNNSAFFCESRWLNSLCIYRPHTHTNTPHRIIIAWWLLRGYLWFNMYIGHEMFWSLLYRLIPLLKRNKKITFFYILEEMKVPIGFLTKKVGISPFYCWKLKYIVSVFCVWYVNVRYWPLMFLVCMLMSVLKHYFSCFVRKNRENHLRLQKFQ